MIGLRVTEKFKRLLQQQAMKENRSLSNFIETAVLHYLKTEKKIDFKEDDKAG